MDSPPLYQCCQPALLLAAVDGDRAVFHALAQIFQQESVARLDDIVRASAAGAFVDMGFEAHSLKGTVGVVGATTLVRLLQDIEHAGLKHAQPCSPEQLALLRQQLQLARDDMASFAATL